MKGVLLALVAIQLASASPRPRIIGGITAETGQFPYQVAVYYDTAAGSFFCGGALISDTAILTAAYCVDGATIFTLHLGSNSLVEDDPNRLTVATTNKVVHPDYNATTLDNNIGIIKLITPVVFNDYIQPIPLSAVGLIGNEDVRACGWGATGDWDGVNPELAYVDLTTITNEQCRSVYGEAILDNMICAIGEGNDNTCNGDTGGPLIQKDALGNDAHVGVISFQSSNGCHNPDPAGFTKTAHYVDWILEAMK